MRDDWLALDRRTVLGAGMALAAVPALARDAGVGIGRWEVGALGLPAYRYTGPLIFATDAGVPNDPWFLLGNHRLTAFVHASGRLRLLSGERGWATTNAAHAATLTVADRRIDLIGPAAPAAASATKVFGVGTARFVYAAVAGITVARRIAVAPSATVGGGESALLITIEVRNISRVTHRVAFAETFAAAYAPVAPPWSDLAAQVRFDTRVAPVEGDVIRADTVAVELVPLALATRPHAARADRDPPSLFAVALAGCTVSTTGGVGIAAAIDLAPGATHRVQFVVGHAFGSSNAVLHDLARTFAGAATDDGFAPAWRTLVPAFAAEPDPVLRREMQWHAATLEAMATWREYDDETIVPQGSTYDYAWGITASARDLAQHVLPLCTLRPALARSVIRHLFKRMTPDGAIMLNDEGFGWSASGPMQTSDQQLYLFMLVAEYLRATGDRSVLTEAVAWHPAEQAIAATGFDHLTQGFVFLRDRIGTGPHGLVKLWNSDWNDLFYQWPTTVPYNELFGQAESHMNSAMAVVVLADLAAQVDADAEPLADAMRRYGATLDTAFAADLATRSFSRRAYLGRAGVVGDDAMWLEPQGFTLLGPLPESRRRSIWTEVRMRLLAGEALGPRQIERGPAQGDLKFGQRENGGFWYALAGPVILGVARFDPAAAWALLRGQTLAAFARHYPATWTGQWTAADSIDATALASPGRSTMLPWCAHAHAWPLYAYLKLRALRLPET